MDLVLPTPGFVLARGCVRFRFSSSDCTERFGLGRQVPVFVGGGLVAVVAVGDLPLVLAGWAAAAGPEGVPDVAAFAYPARAFGGKPLAFGAADALIVGSFHRRSVTG